MASHTESLEFIKFRGHDNPLSNFYPCELDVFGVHCKSSEHAYQYRKAMELNKPDIALKILNAPTASDAKYISNSSLEIDDRWHDIKDGVMFDVLTCKANQCSSFHHMLKSTSGKTLVEDTSDPYWARGPDGRGQNRLGQLLMTLRQNVPRLLTRHAQYKYQNDPRTKKNHAHQGSHRSEQSNSCCWNCGESNHVKDNCRFGKKIQCHGCNIYGHKKNSPLCPLNSC